MCLYPRLIKNRKYTATKKNGGIIPPITDKRTLLVPVGCGKCIECMKQKGREWQMRLLEDVKKNKNGIMVTLTFSNESYSKLAEEIAELDGYDMDNQVARIAVRRFLERWRKKYKKSLRHWLVTELGSNGTENIHIHGIVWTDIEREEITRVWDYGFTYLGDGKGGGYVSERTANYIVKYVMKTDVKHPEYKSIILTSPGIGANYIQSQDAKRHKYRKGETIETFRNRKGYEMAIPIYLRNKLFTEEEREKLWLEKLDKMERWICGEKVDISKGEETYYKLLDYHRKRNKRLGYGDDSINWSRKRYERERRLVMQRKRIQDPKHREKYMKEAEKIANKVLTGATAGQAF